MTGADKVAQQRKELVEKVVSQIQDGKPFFWDPGYAQQGRLINAATDTTYRGGNIIRLAVASMENGYTDPRWVTFNQAKEKGWHVKRGEHGTQLEYWKEVKPRDEKENKELPEKEKETSVEKPKRFFRAALFTVFNAAQIEGIPPLPNEAAHKEDLEKQRIKALETVISHSEAPVLQDYMNANFYAKDTDEIHVMPKELFSHADHYYSTVIHEIGHSTGAEKRLNRPMEGSFGSPDYAREELRAELVSMFMAQELNTRFDESHFQNHAAYLQSWAKALRDDPNELFRAASDADKAVQYIHENMLDKFLEHGKTQEQGAVRSGGKEEIIQTAGKPAETETEYAKPSVVSHTIERRSKRPRAIVRRKTSDRQQGRGVSR